MGKTICCNCNKEIAITSFKFSKEELWDISSHSKVMTMSSDDKLCNNCKRLFDEELNPKQEETHTNTKVKAKESSKEIKIAYYSGLFSIITGPVVIIWGIMTEFYWLVLAGSIGVMIGLVQYSGRKKKFDSLSKTDDEPLAVLKMRLVKGEITKEEFDKIKEDLI
jgi:uncharacterized membrane protein